MKQVDDSFFNFLTGSTYGTQDIVNDAIKIIKKSKAKDIFRNIKQVNELGNKPRVSVTANIFYTYLFSGELSLSLRHDSTPESVAKQIVKSIGNISEDYQQYEKKPSIRFWDNVFKFMDDLDFDH